MLSITLAPTTVARSADELAAVFAFLHEKPTPALWIE